MQDVIHLPLVELASEWAERAQMTTDENGPQDTPAGVRPHNEERYAALSAEMRRRGFLTGPDGTTRLELPRFHLRGKLPVFQVPLCVAGALVSPLVGLGAFEDPYTAGWLGTSFLVLSVAIAGLLGWLAIRLPFLGLRVDRRGILVSNTYSRTLVAWADLLGISYKPLVDANDPDAVLGWIYVFLTSDGEVLASQPEARDTGADSPMERRRRLLLALRDAYTV